MSNKVKPTTGSTTPDCEEEQFRIPRCCSQCNAVTFGEGCERFKLKPQVQVMRSGYNRNFTYLMSQLVIKLGRVHLEVCLSDISKQPLDASIQHNSILFDVDEHRLKCTSCKLSTPTKAPYPLGFFNLPPYIEPSTIILSFLSNQDTLVIEACVKGAIL